jgi:hypothetical protein
VPTSTTPVLPVITTPVPRKVQRLIPETGTDRIDEYMGRLQRGLADPIDNILAWLNANFGVPAAVRNVSNQGTVNSPIQQTTQTAQQQTALVGPGAAALSIPSLTATTVSTTTLTAPNITTTTVNGLPAITRSKYMAGSIHTRLNQFTASQTNISMIPEGYAEPTQIVIPYAGSIAAIGATFTANGPTAGTISIKAQVTTITPSATVATPLIVPNTASIQTATFAPGVYPFAANSYANFWATTSSTYATNASTPGAVCVYLYLYDP